MIWLVTLLLLLAVAWSGGTLGVAAVIGILVLNVIAVFV